MDRPALRSARNEITAAPSLVRKRRRNSSNPLGRWRLMRSFHRGLVSALIATEVSICRGGYVCRARISISFPVPVTGQPSSRSSNFLWMRYHDHSDRRELLCGHSGEPCLDRKTILDLLPRHFVQLFMPCIDIVPSRLVDRAV